MIAVDIPIGLTDHGKRAADVEARHVLKHPRASSVFPAPIRPILDARTREYASRLHKEVDGRGFGVQSWAILPRIRDWDVALQANRERTCEVFEVHPEVSFWALNGGESIKEGKKTKRGASKRRKLVVKIFGEDAVSRLLEIGQQRGAARDDVFDALVALWSAGRIARREARSLPHPPEFDRAKLTVAIWY